MVVHNLFKIKHPFKNKKRTMTYSISKHIFWPFIKLFIKRIEGLDNLPQKSFIIAANHQSYIDAALLIFLVAKYRNMKLYTFATRKRYTNIFWRIIFSHFGAIRVNGGIVKGLDKLKSGNVIGLFPEGAITYDGKIQQVTHFGLGVLCLNAKVPIVPIGLYTFDFWNRYYYFPRFRKNIQVTIGKPLEFSLSPSEENYKKATHQTMNEVKRLARISQQRATQTI